MYIQNFYLIWIEKKEKKIPAWKVDDDCVDNNVIEEPHFLRSRENVLWLLDTSRYQVFDDIAKSKRALRQEVGTLHQIVHKMQHSVMRTIVRNVYNFIYNFIALYIGHLVLRGFGIIHPYKSTLVLLKLLCGLKLINIAINNVYATR